MNIGLNVDDYYSSDVFLDVLKQALRQKGRKLAKKATNSIDSCSEYDNTLPEYLYWRMLGFNLSDSFDGISTFDIDVAEVGGEGQYYFLYGDRRKPNNPVTFKVTPPDGLYVNRVTTNFGTVTPVTSDTYSFTKAPADESVIIVYGEESTNFTVYWGLSEDEVLTSDEILSGNTLSVNQDTPITFEVPYNNDSDNLKYLWVTCPIELVSNSIKINDSLTLTDTITEAFSDITVSGINDKVYLHKWSTAVDHLKFSTTTFTELQINSFSVSPTSTTGSGSFDISLEANKDLTQNSITEIKLVKIVGGFESVMEDLLSNYSGSISSNTISLSDFFIANITQDITLKIKITDTNPNGSSNTVYSDGVDIISIANIEIVEVSVDKNIVYVGENTFDVTVTFDQNIDNSIFSVINFGGQSIDTTSNDDYAISGNTLTFTISDVVC